MIPKVLWVLLLALSLHHVHASPVRKPPARAVAAAAAAAAAWNKDELLALLSRSTPAPLRVHFHFAGLTDDDSNIDEEQAAVLTDTLAPAVTAIIKRFVKARVPETAPLKAPWFDETACSAEDGYLIPEQMRENGIPDTDLVLVVRSSSEYCEDGTLASAITCDRNPVTLRPTVGDVTVCAAMFDQVLAEQVSTLLHEVAHILGISSNEFPYFYDASSGNKYARIVNEGKAYAPASKGQLPVWLVTPRATAFARAHFGCGSLPGAPLEPGTRSDKDQSHWHMRYVPLESMCAATLDTAQISRLTRFSLALLEDSGWYVTNNELAEAPEYLWGVGCSITRDCNAFLRANPSTTYVCKKQGDTVCTGDHKVIASCDVAEGGKCLAPIASSDDELWDCTSSAVRSDDDDDGDDDDSQFENFVETNRQLGGATGPDARCLPVTTTVCRKGSDTCAEWPAMCAAMRCNAAGNIVVAFQGASNATVTCKQGEKVDLKRRLPRLFSSGVFTCPDPRVLCPTLSCRGRCSPERSNCWNGSCICRYMYAGADCKQNLIPGVLG